MSTRTTLRGTPPPGDERAGAQRARVHPDVLKLGLVSFLTDLSSEMIFSVFAVFFTRIAGASSAETSAHSPRVTVSFPIVTLPDSGTI